MTRQLDGPSGEKQKFLNALVSGLYDRPEPSEDGSVSAIHLSPSRKEKIQKRFLLQLYYSSMQARESSIAEAHEKTFRWLFDDSSSSFKKWLQSEDQLYWITGKAGSGKSTLMRYISQPTTNAEVDILSENERTGKPRCAEYLETWAGTGTRVLMASFYFWAAGGSGMHTSQIGLLRSLLFQLLSASPDTIPIVAPNRWEVLSLFGEDPRDFSEKELHGMLCRTIKSIAATSKVVLFIDGLDEFDGELGPLIELIHRLTKDFPIKVCVASRSWPEFEDAFDSKPSLMLEHLTFSDIKDYAMAEFQKNTSFVRLQRKKAEKLITSIVQKASGVFLWVKLVVASLLSGLEHGDRIEDLEKRLAALPPELMDLYGKMLDQIHEDYKERALQFFHLRGACAEPPSLLLFSFADEKAFTNVAVHLNAEDISEEELQDRRDDVRLRVKGLCKGLLEVRTGTRNTNLTDTLGGDETIWYLHITVMEYVQSPEALKKFEAHITEPYDPHVRLLAAHLAVSKLCYWKQTPRNILRLPFSTTKLFEHGSLCGTDHKDDVVDILDDLFDFMKHHGLEFWMPQSSGDHLINFVDIESQFLCIAVFKSVVEYVKAKADWGCQISVQEELFAETATAKIKRKLLRRPKTPTFFSLLTLVDWGHPNSSAMIQAILSKKADPNLGQLLHFSHHAYTPWEMALANVIVAFFKGSKATEEEKANIMNCAKLMVEGGADVSARTVRWALDLIGLGSEPTELMKRLHEEIRRSLVDLKKRQESELRLDSDYGLPGIDLPYRLGKRLTRASQQELSAKGDLAILAKASPSSNLGRESHPERLLASSVLGDLYCFSREAGVDLRTYWETNSPTPDRHGKLLWLATQFQGITGGLAMFYQSEMKSKLDSMDKRFTNVATIPETIFLSPHDEDSDPGVLRLEKFRRGSSINSLRSRGHAFLFSPTYRAPEFDSSVVRFLSPASEVWALGCVYLEFFTWWLGGWSYVREFSKRRVDRDPGYSRYPNFTSDAFFSVTTNKNEDSSEYQVKQQVTEVSVL